MKYITGIHALNLPCALDTCGDWHVNAIRWDTPRTADSNTSIFGEWGIEKNRELPFASGEYNIANHIRAILDMLAIGNYPIVQGFKDDFICNDEYDSIIFDMAIKLKDMPVWNIVDNAMGREYKCRWLDYMCLLQKPCSNKNLLKEHTTETNYLVAEYIDDLAKKYRPEMFLMKLNEFTIKKAMLYCADYTIRDLYDIAFICNNHYESLSEAAKESMRIAVEHKGFEQFDYIMRTQSDELINVDKLANDYLSMYDKLGLLYESPNVEKTNISPQKKHEEYER